MNVITSDFSKYSTMRFIVFIPLIYSVFFWSCIEENDSQHHYSNAEYNLDKPDKVYILPKELKEISGIAWKNDSILFIIQDEDGVIYSYDLKLQRIIDEVSFAGSGDYEGVTLFQNDIYILRSDGVIFRYYMGATEKIKTGLHKDENTEAIAYDTVHYRLLIGSKSNGTIYLIDINTPEKKADTFIKLKKDKISISDMAIHPNTQDLYVLSDKKLTIIDPAGKLKEIIFLKSSLFPNPEGITFNKNGDIFISNEGNGHTADILFFKRNNTR